MAPPGGGRCPRVALPPGRSRKPDGVNTSFVYTLDRIAHAADTKHAPAMHASAASRLSNRPPDNELYDRGGDLAESATASEDAHLALGP